METYLALLRAINVGGRAAVSMAALRTLAAGLGFEDPRTVLRSGNLVFRAPATATSSIEQLLEEEISTKLGVETDVVVRTANQWRRVVERNPFPEAAVSDPSHLVVMALERAPKPAGLAALQASIKGRELTKASGSELYLVFPDGIGRSKLTGAVIERALGTRGTARNWKTVLKLSALCRDPAKGSEGGPSTAARLGDGLAGSRSR